ncbi:MAG TPA: AAA family ATPase [Candidatus Eremiobacteraceae bacterium]|nr:AAA family ATPase [Candidatus Eremiobacteraceae bacterium]
MGQRSLLVGREFELSLITSRLSPAAIGQGSVVLISGEPGIGKTRLLREIVYQAESLRAIATVGQCYEYLQSPLGPVADILVDLHEKDKHALERFPDIRTVVDALTSTAANEAAIENLDKRKLFTAVRGAIDAYARERPVLLALDDLHCADALTLDLVQYLAEHVPRSRLVIVATYRSGDTEQSDRLRRALANLARGANAFHSELSPLSQEHIRGILRSVEAATSSDDIRRIAIVAQQSDGNPLLAEELFKAAGTATIERTETLPLPVSVRAATLARIALLEPDERRLLVCAAAIGRRFTPALVEQIAQQSAADVLAALKQGVQLQLIEPDADGKSFHFRHELVRRAIYDDLLPNEAQALHARVAAALESAPDSPQRIADLAYHYWMAAQTVKAADFNEESGDRAFRLSAYSVAAENYERALRSLGSGAPERTAAIQERRGDALYHLGLGEAAQAAFFDAREFYESRRNVEAIARLSVKIGILYLAEGRSGDAIKACELALTLVDENSPTFFRAHSYLGYMLTDSDGDAAREHFRLADRYTGVRAPNDALVFHQCRALALGQLGDVDAMAANFHDAYRIAREQGDVSLAVRCLGNLGLKLMDLGERTRSLRAFAEAATLMEEEELWDLDCAVCVRQNAWANVQFGDLPVAKTLILRALEFPTDSLRLRSYAAQAALLIGVRTMDDELARRFDSSSELESILSPGNESLLVTALAFAEREIALGRATEGAALIHRVVEAYAAVPFARDDDGAFVLAALHSSDSDARTARAFVARYVDDTKSKIASAHLLLYDAVLARRSGDTAQATARAESARDLYEKLGWRWHVARSLEISGKLRDAIVAYEHTGDVRSVQRLKEILDPVNRRGRTKSELTEREREIATLAAAGRSTKEIADALTLSPRTIETHLASIFAKLEVRNRAELIAKWRDLPGAAQASP